MRKINRSALLTRPVIARLTFVENGEKQQDDFKIIYNCMTPALTREVRELQLQAEKTLEINPDDAEAKKAYATALAKMVKEIPGIVEGEEGAETPIRIDADTLDGLFDWQNLRAIDQAITDDVNPKQQPSGA